MRQVAALPARVPVRQVEPTRPGQALAPPVLALRVRLPVQLEPAQPGQVPVQLEPAQPGQALVQQGVPTLPARVRVAGPPRVLPALVRVLRLPAQAVRVPVQLEPARPGRVPVQLEPVPPGQQQEPTAEPVPVVKPPEVMVAAVRLARLGLAEPVPVALVELVRSVQPEATTIISLISTVCRR